MSDWIDTLLLGGYSALKPIIKIKAYDHVTEEFHNRMLYLFVCVSNKIVRKCNYKMS